MPDPDWQGTTVVGSTRTYKSKWDMADEGQVKVVVAQDTLTEAPDDRCDGDEANRDLSLLKDNGLQSSEQGGFQDERADNVYPELSPPPTQIFEKSNIKEDTELSICELSSGIQNTLKEGDARVSAVPEVASPQGWEGSSMPSRVAWSRSPRSQSWSRSPNQGWNKNTRRSLSRSRSRSRGRSLSRSRSRDRSCTRNWSPSYGSRSVSEKWVSRDITSMRMGVEFCRNFAAGRCRNGIHCRFLHEDVRKQYDRPHDSRRDMMTERRFDRKRPEYENREDVGLRDQRHYSKDEFSNRNRSHYASNQGKSELRKNNRSTERCYDFTRGRCYRGSACIYVHSDAPLDSGRFMQAQTRESARDGREVDSSFGQRLRSQRSSDIPCMFFSKGTCNRGDQCKFSHRDMPHGVTEVNPSDIVHDFDNKAKNTSWTGFPGGGEIGALDGVNSSPWTGEDNHAAVVVSRSTGRNDRWPNSHHPNFDNAVHEHHEVQPQQSPLCVPSSQENLSQEASATKTESSHEGGNIVVNNTISSTEMHGSKIPRLAPIPKPVKIIGQNALNKHIVPQNQPGQILNQSIQMQHAIPMPSSGLLGYPQPPNWHGQMQQQQVCSVPPSGQYMGLQASVHAQNFNLSAQPVFPSPNSTSDKLNCNPGGQPQHNLPQFAQGQQMVNLIGQTQKALPSSGQNQLNLGSVGQIQQNIPVQSGPNMQNLFIPDQIQQTFSSHGQHLQSLIASNLDTQSISSIQNGQTKQIVHSVMVDGAAQSVAIQSSPKRQEFNLPRTNDHSGGDIPQKLATESTVAQKVLTSEQAAQITNLSASLAQFFATGPQLPQLHTTVNAHIPGMVPQQPSLNPCTLRPPAPETRLCVASTQGSLIQQPADSGSDESMEPPGFSSVYVEQKDFKLDDSESKSKCLVPLAPTATFGSPSGSCALEGSRMHDGNIVAKQLELTGTEATQDKKDQTAHSEDMDLDVRTDGESKRNKDAKGIRMFKSALVEFVKDILKPTWREGQLSKEAHKTIVKKVVEKVSNVMPGSNIPQTPEKIDVYLSHSKGKLTKLVQAYVEKYSKA